MRILLTIGTLLGLLVTTVSSEEKSDLKEQKGFYFDWFHFDKKLYAVRLTDDEYDALGEWKVTANKPAPVTLQKAYKLTRERVNQIEIPENYFWHFEDASLIPPEYYVDGKWVWRISFSYMREGFNSGQRPKAYFYVSMCGKLLEPTITELKKTAQQDAAGQSATAE